LIGSAALGILLPLLCHYAIEPDDRAGARMSYIYLANIIGSGAGSLVTGFILMETLALWQIVAVLLFAGTLLAFLLARRAGPLGVMDWAMCVFALILVCSAWPLHDGIYERLQYGNVEGPKPRFAQIVESRHGVVAITQDRRIYGGGVYDGVIDTGIKEGNPLIRPYFISALHSKPREVLVIGMSGGAWTQILANNPDVEHVTVVEISSAYLKVIAAWPQVSSLLTNSKVNIVIDDGRRWMRRNPARKFDAIVMNTTFHWREFASALLSREFLTTTRDHLNPGGIAMWNTTDSARAARTGMDVFPHTMMIYNNCVGSMAPLVVNREHWRSVMSAYQIDGHPLFRLDTEQGRKDLEAVLAFGEDAPAAHPRWRLMSRPEMQHWFGTAPVITEDNLGSEYGIGLDAFTASLMPGLKKVLFPRAF
jgi:spermidine synthase